MKTLLTAEQRKNLEVLNDWMGTLIDAYNMQPVKDAAYEEARNRMAAELEDLRESLKYRDAVINELLNGLYTIRTMIGAEEGEDILAVLEDRFGCKHPDAEEKKDQESKSPSYYVIVSTWNEQ